MPSLHTRPDSRGHLLKAGRPFFACALLLTILLAAGAMELFLRPVKAATFTVCAVGCTHTTIQAAVNAADATAETDIINVQPGNYPERVIIPASEPGLVINGANFGINACTGSRGAESVVGITTGAFQINANNVTINGFTIQGVDGMVPTSFGAGVNLSGGVSGTQILNNIIQNNTFGIYLKGSDALVQGNNIRNNNVPGPANGNGIYADQGLTNSTVTANCFSGHNTTATNFIGGPCFGQPVSNIQVTNNTVTSDAAFQFIGGTGYTITGNTSISSDNDSIFFAGGVNGATVSGNNLANGTGSGVLVSTVYCPGNPNTNITINCNHLVNFGANAITVNAGAYTGTINAENNWYGCNAGPGMTGCETVVAPDSNVDFNPWLVLTTTLSPNPPMPGGVATFTAHLNNNSNGGASGCGLNGVPVTFASTCGPINPTATTLTNGSASATVNTPNPLASCVVSATVDNQFGTINTCVTNPPAFVSTLPVSRQQGSQPVNLQIATVMDAEDAEETLMVLANGAMSAVVNGVTIQNITVNAAGQVRADILVSCTATTATFNLTVKDSCMAVDVEPFTVNVSLNTPPSVGNYPNTTVASNGTLTITPDVPPTDSNTVVSVTATADGGFTGSFSGNTSTGGVTVMNANPLGSFNVTVKLTDNCGAMTTRMFVLTVSVCGATLSKQRELFAANGGNDSFNVMIDPMCIWSAVSNDPWIVINTPPGGTAVGPGMVSYTVLSHNNHMRRQGSITVAGQTFRVLQGAMFNDVPLGAQFYTEIGKISALGITIGCGDGSNYCPDDNTSREQMAIFIERAIGVFNPPEPMQQTFADVPPTKVGYPFIEDLVARGITQGCAVGPPRLYCPNDQVTRDQMAIFIVRARGFFNPPDPGTQTFADVPNSGATDLSFEFIEKFYALGITQGCDAGPPLRYCPFDPVSRRQMAAFLLRAFGM